MLEFLGKAVQSIENTTEIILCPKIYIILMRLGGQVFSSTQAWSAHGELETGVLGELSRLRALLHCMRGFGRLVDLAEPSGCS